MGDYPHKRTSNTTPPLPALLALPVRRNSYQWAEEIHPLLSNERSAKLRREQNQQQDAERVKPTT